MIGVTIGIGGLWPEIARNAAARMEQATGLLCYVVGDRTVGRIIFNTASEPASVITDTYNDGWPEVIHPSWMKCHLLKLFPREQDFLVFDADIVCMEAWAPEDLFVNKLKRTFTAVPDRNHRIVYDECTAHSLPFPDWYINGGLLMFSREHAPLWDAVSAKHPRYGRWLEQTALNKSIQELGLEVARLPRIFNCLPHLDTQCRNSSFNLQQLHDRGVINFHFADCGGNGAPILVLQKKMGFSFPITP